METKKVNQYLKHLTTLTLDAPDDTETTVQVHELVKNATFAQMFGSFGTDLNKLCLTQEQMLHFCEKHPQWLQRNLPTFFLFNFLGKVLVAYVRVFSDGLDVYVGRLGYDDVWGAEYGLRVVVPQLDV